VAAIPSPYKIAMLNLARGSELRPQHEEPSPLLDLDQAIRERRSTRMFLSRPVPRELVDDALTLAQLAPSNSDTQPWHVVFATGARRDNLIAALLDETRHGPPNIPPLPKEFQHYRRELGAQVYGAMGIPITDTAGHAAAVLRNWEFFRAPLAGVFADLAVGLDRTWYGSCIEASVTGYSEIVRAQLSIPAELSILCGLAVGFPDPDFPANRLHVAREPIKEHAVFLDNDPK
jgi:nitroreductase